MPVYKIVGKNGKTYRLEGPAGVPREQVIAEVLKRAPEAGQAASPIEKIPGVGGALSAVADVPLNLLSGVANTGKTFTDLFGANNVASRALDTVSKGASDLTSAESRADFARDAAEMANAKGAWESVKAAGSAALRHPLDVGANLLGSSIPYMASVLAAPETGGTSLAPVAAALGLGAASGAGMIKGDIYDAVYARAKQGGASDDQASAIADKAQEYGGANTDMITLGGVIGAIANSTGISSQLAESIGKRAAGDIFRRVAARTAEGGAEKGLLRRVGEGVVEEAIPEGMQAAQERYSQNVAQQRAGYETDPLAGVVEQGLYEGTLGGLFGGALGATHRGPEDVTPKEMSDDDAEAIQQAADAVTAAPSGETQDALAARLVAAGIDPARAQSIADTRRKQAEAATPAPAEEPEAEPDTGEVPEYLRDIPPPVSEDDYGAVPPPASARPFAPPEAEPAGELAPQGEEVPAHTEADYRRQALTSLISDDASIRRIADQYGIDEQEAIERLQAEIDGLAPTSQPVSPATAIPPVESITPTAQFSQEMEAAQPAPKEAFDESQYPPLTDEDYTYQMAAGRGRPPKDIRAQAEAAGQVDMFGGALTPQTAPSAEAKREEVLQQQLTGTREERAALQQQQIEEQARLGQKQKEAEDDRKLDELDDLQYRLDAQEEDSQPKYAVTYDPTAEQPFKVTGNDGITRVEAKTLPEFKQAVEERLNPEHEESLVPYTDLTTASGQTVEQGREMAPTVATSMVQELTGTIDKARSAGLIDNNQRSQLLSMLVRPDIHNAVRTRFEAIAEGEAAAREAMSELRNAKNDIDRKAAEARLAVVNDDLKRVMRNTLTNPVMARLRTMTEGRIDELTGATIRKQGARLQRKLGEAEKANTTAEQREEREAKIDIREARAPSNLLEQNLLDDPSEEEAKTVEAALRGKSVVQAAEWLAQNSPDKLSSVVAKQVANTLRSLERAGLKFELHIVNLGDMRPAVMGRARGLIQMGKELADTKHVWLHGSDVTGLVGTSYRTALHELIHAATVSAFRRVNADTKKFEGSQLGNAVGDIKKVANSFVDFFNARVREAKAGGAPLNEFEQAIFNKNINATHNFEEVIAWGLSSPHMQEYMARIPYYGKQTLWGKFVDALKSLFRIPGAENSALAELLRASESLMTAPEEELRAALGIEPVKAQATSLLDFMEHTGATATEPQTAADIDRGMDRASIGAMKTDMSQSVNDMKAGLKDMFAGHDSVGFVAALKQNFAWLSEPMVKKILLGLPTSGILDWVEDEFTTTMEGEKGRSYRSNPLEATVNEVNKMQNLKQNLLKGADKIAKRFATYVNQGPEAEKALATAQSQARINEFSPTEHTSVADAMQNDKALAGIESRILKNSNDKVKSKEAVDALKAEVAAHRAESAAARTARAKLVQYAVNKDEAKSRAKQIHERAISVRDTMEAWEKLGEHKGGQALYKEVRQYYEDMFNAELALLDQRIEGFPDAEGRKRLREVRAEIMSKAANVSEGQKADDLFHDLPAEWFPKDYFPFMREGKYWLRVKGESRKGREPRQRAFYTFNTAADRAKAHRELARKYGADMQDNSIFEKGHDVADLAESFRTDDAMMQKVFETLSKLKADSTFGKADVQDVINDVYQVWLMSSPERSVRRRFLRSEEVAGFSSNVMLHFQKQATAYANQISKLSHANAIRTQLESAKALIKDRPVDERAKLEAVVVEIGKRAESEINPAAQNSWVNLLNRFSFAYYLTSGATALTQLTSIPIRTVPRLWKDFGYAKGTKIWLKYMKVWQTVGLPHYKDSGEGTLTRIMPSLKGFAAKNPVLARAWQEGEDRNILNTTAATLINNERAAPTSKLGTAQSAMSKLTDVMGAAFTASENISRQASFLMAFELKHDELRAKGMAAEDAYNDAIEYASKTTKDTLGDFSSIERPSLLKSDWMRALTLFRSFSIAQTKWIWSAHKSLVKSGYGSLVGTNKAAMRKELAGTARELTGVMMMAGLFGGIAGMPLYTIMIHALMAAFGNDGDDDDDVRDMIGKDPRIARDPDLLFREWMQDKFGAPSVPGLDGRHHYLGDILTNGPISELSDINIGSRTSMDLYGMWFRDSISDKSSMQTFVNLALNNVAGGSMVKSFADAYDDLQNGDIDRALQKAAPAFFRSWLAAEQISREGVTTRKGETVMSKDEFSSPLIIPATALGFRSQRLSDLQRAAITRAKNDKAIEDTRSKIMQDFDKLVIGGGTAADVEQYVRDKIAPFNRKYPHPDFIITNDSLESSLKTSMADRAKQARGMQFTKKGAAIDIKAVERFVPHP